MTKPIHRRNLLQLAAATSLSGLAGLLPQQARACEFFTSTLRVTHPWTRASEPKATTAVICMKFDQVSENDRLIGVESPVAGRAEIGGIGASKRLNLAIPAEQVTELSETGTFIRLLDLKHPLEMARSYPLTLVFEVSGRVEADLSVDYESLAAR